MARIFISYRREDSGSYARRLYERLASHFGAEHVFIDTDTLIPGEDFVRAIEESVDACDVLLAVVGKTWLASSDVHGTRRRLDNPHDFVRLEIGRALSRGIPVIPVLVAGARMPDSDQLPTPLSGLARRQAWELRDPGFRRIDRLLRAIEMALLASRERQATSTVLPEATVAAEAEIAEMLQRAAKEWDSTLDRDPGALLRGVRLARVDQWSRRQTHPLPSVARRFLEASLAVRDEEEAAERERSNTASRVHRERKRLGLALVLVSTFGPASAYYAGGLTEWMIGASAPWCVLAIMILACGVRGLHVESEAVLGKGDVYTVVREALGATPAKLATFALLFDYVLIASISTLTAATLMLRFANEFSELIHNQFRMPLFTPGAILAAVLSGRIWRAHIVDIERPGRELGKSMAVATAVFVILMAWVGLTATVRGELAMPPLPLMTNLPSTRRSFGWLDSAFFSHYVPLIPMIPILVAVGHAMIAMSGDDTLAEVSRMIASLKLQRFRGSVFITFLNSFIFPAFVPFAAVMIVPLVPRADYFQNIIGGVVHYLAGPFPARLVTYVVVALIGVSVLLNAASRAMAGARLLLQQAAADGALTQWFRHSHPRYGTPHRLLHLVFALQLIALIACRGDVMELAQVYAFGIAWGFALKAASVAVLRYKMPQARDWKIPLNIRFGGHELPVGIGLLATALLALACVNLIARERATICGLTFTAIFFLAFDTAARYSRRMPSGL